MERVVDASSILLRPRKTTDSDINFPIPAFAAASIFKLFRVPPANVAKVEHNTCTLANGLLARSMIDFDDQCGQTKSVGN